METETVIKVTLKLGKPMAIKVIGTQGSSCKALTKPLEQLGAVENFTTKPEFYAQSVTTTATVTQSL
jgi:ribosomal protein S3